MLKMASTFLLLATLFGAAYGMVLVVSPQSIAARTYEARTGEKFATVKGSDIVGTLMTETRHLGVFAVAVSVVLLFVLSGFRRAEKWAWWAFLASGLMTWGYGLVVESVEMDMTNLVGHFIGLVLWMTGLILPLKIFFPKAPSPDLTS